MRQFIFMGYLPHILMFMLPLAVSFSDIKNEDVNGVPRTDSIYNDAKLIFHALNPKYNSPELQGYDPPRALEVMSLMLDGFVIQNPDLTTEMKTRVSNIQKSLSRAKINYLTCIQFVFTPDAVQEHELAQLFAENVKDLAANPSDPSLLFTGGHYIVSKEGNLGGHTVIDDVVCQPNGKLQFVINNSGTKAEKYHKTTEDRIDQLVYEDLEIDDLDEVFWRELIRTNFNNPVSSDKLMDSFYASVDAKLLKANNKTSGRPIKRQRAGVCAWKSLISWLHGAIAPGKFKKSRDPYDELVFLKFKKFMFENMLANFNPTPGFKATIGKKPGTISQNEDSFYVEDGAAADFLKIELKRKIKKLDEKIKT